MKMIKKHLAPGGRLWLPLPACLLLQSLMPAAEVTSPVTASATITLSANEKLTTTDIAVADGATLTITRTGTANNSTAVFPDGSLTIRPETPGGTGRVVFRDVRGTINGVILSLASAATVNITGADFINTYQPTSPAGVFYIYNAGASLTLTDFLADGNSAGNTGFARITTGTLIMNDGIIRNSYTRTMTTSGHTGALGIYGTGAKTVEINRVLFEGNRTFDAGGAIKIGGANDATVANFSGTFTNAVFKDNWAAGRGGAVISAHMNGDLVFKMTAAGGATQYHYTGNAAYGNADAAVFTAAMLAANNTGTHAAAASAGGFYYASSSSPAVLKFDIDPGVSLTIGDADDTGNDKDSIVGTTAHTLKKTGGGDLILNANNSFWRGAVEVSGGRLLLGREAALLGGSAITVGPGATLGGSGTLTTAGAPGAASVVAGPGATIQIGLAGRMTEKLVIDGTLSLTDAILSFVAFGGTHAATLEVTGSLIASGSNTVNIQSFNTGIYNLGQLKSPLADSATVSLTINGAAQVAGGRQIATWVDHATDLIVDYSADASRLLKWTGLSGTAWNSAEASWQGVNTPAVTQYAAGDFVQFPGDAPGDLSIAIDDPVQITGMDVSGAGAIVFSGAGGITATAWQGGGPDDEDAVKAGTGRLVKNGSGALVFANDGANVFNGGIEINGGVIEFSHGRQIQTGAGAIVAGQSGTLRAGDSTAVENHIQIGPGRSLVFDTGANAVTQAAGGISGAGTFIKIGTGTLALNVANTAPVELCAGVLALGHGGAIGGGLAVTGGGSLDAAGGLAVRGGISIGVPALNIKNTGGEAAVFSGPIVGASAALSVFGRIGFSGANTFAALSVKPGAVLTAGGAGALGGAGADVTVENGATLNLGALEVAAGSLTVRGGATLGFADLKATAAPFLRVTGALALENSSTIAIVNAPSRRIWLASAAGGVTDGGASIVITGDGAQSDVLVDIRDGDLRVTHVNLSANPGKDIAVAFDAVSAAAGAIHARLDEGFLSPFMERREGGPGRGLWLKGAGSFADYDGDSGRIGHRDRIYGGVVGLDKVFGERLLLGAVLGWAGAEIKTDNHAATDADIYSAGVYGSLKLGPFYFTADFLLGTLAADTSRPEGFAGRANGSYKGTVAGAGAGVGLVLPLWKNATLRPSAEMHRLSFDFRDHGEGYNAGGLQGLVILDDFRAVRWEGLVNLRFSQGFTLPWKLPGALDLLAGWRSSLADDDPVVLGAAFAADLDDRFAITSDEYGRDRFAAGLALRLGLTRRAGLVLAGEHEFIEHGSRDSFAASVRWSW